MHVLIVGDDRGSRRLEAALSEDGVMVSRIPEGDLRSTATADVAVLDLAWSNADGAAACRSIRQLSDVPIIVIAPRASTDERVAAFAAGADDYLVEPVSAAELRAKIRALARRRRAQAPTRQVIEFGNVVIDLETAKVLVAGEDIGLTRKEFQLLAVIAQAGGDVCPADSLAQQIWGQPREDVSESIHVLISRIRAKLGCRAILQTVRTTGYRIATTNRPAPTSCSGEPEPYR